MVDPSLQSWEGIQEAYFFVSGFRGNGEPWQDPTQGYAETKFPFAGDPVQGTGWLLESITSCKDVRGGMSSGPFDLSVGQSQEVVIALVAGQGLERLASVSVMKQNDRQVQTEYDRNFKTIEVPQPQVTVGELDRSVILTWDDSSTRLEEEGYKMEGFNIWQGETENGPWTRLATYDRINGITAVRDFQFNEAVEEFIEYTVQFGADTDFRFYYHFDKDLLAGDSLVNGRPYYLAVTAYAVNPDASPKVIESPVTGMRAVPHKPVLDMSIPCAFGDTLEVTRTGPANDGKGVFAIVVDPTHLTGDDYEVNFDTTEDGVLVWNLKNTSTGETVLKDRTNFSGDEDYLIYDGVKVVVDLPTEWTITPDYDKGVYASYGVGYGGCDFTGDRYLTGVDWGGTTFFHGGDLGYAWQGSTLDPREYVDVRIDFWNRAHNEADPVAYPWSDVAAYNRAAGYAFNGIGTFPGAAYDISVPANPRRLNICIVENTVVDLFWDPIAGEAASRAGDGGRELFFIMNSDYSGGVGYEAIQGRSADVQWAFWTTQRGTHTIDEEWSLTMYLKRVVPVQLTNAYSYSTDGYQPVRSEQTARERMDEITVYPNPYFGYQSEEVLSQDRWVTFGNLPGSSCTIRIFSLSGQLVRTLEHENGTPFERWDLANEDGRVVASGMYLIHIRTQYGDRILKLGMIGRKSGY